MQKCKNAESTYCPLCPPTPRTKSKAPKQKMQNAYCAHRHHYTQTKTFQVKMQKCWRYKLHLLPSAHCAHHNQPQKSNFPNKNAENIKVQKYWHPKLLKIQIAHCTHHHHRLNQNFPRKNEQNTNILKCKSTKNAEGTYIAHWAQPRHQLNQLQPTTNYPT